MRETWVWSLGREDPLEKEMETHYIIIKNKPRDRKQARKLYELKKAHRCQYLAFFISLRYGDIRLGASYVLKPDTGFRGNQMKMAFDISIQKVTSESDKSFLCKIKSSYKMRHLNDKQRLLMQDNSYFYCNSIPQNNIKCRYLEPSISKTDPNHQCKLLPYTKEKIYVFLNQKSIFNGKVK